MRNHLLWNLITVLVILLAPNSYGLAQTPTPTPLNTPDKEESLPASATGGREDSASEDETAILSYYNNYLRNYRLGPDDVISVQVFGQPNYSMSNIVVPPTARISYPLIKGGVFVGGRTTEEVEAEIRQKLDEYIIDPQVTVILQKVGSARFGVLGKVGSPGFKVMNRRYNLYEAIVEAGGIAKDGDPKRILLVRLNRDGGFDQTVIDLSELLKGKKPLPYLAPGDQIIVPEKRWSLSKLFEIIGRASAVRILLGSPF